MLWKEAATSLENRINFMLQFRVAVITIRIEKGSSRLHYNCDGKRDEMPFMAKRKFKRLTHFFLESRLKWAPFLVG